MSEVLRDQVDRLFGAAGLELVRLYSSLAFELNAYDVAARRYNERTDIQSVSTTTNIPNDLRLPLEVDFGKDRVELVAHYKNQAVIIACENYLVRCVSLVDGCFEDVYELALEKFSSGLDESQRNSEVLSAWKLDKTGRTNIARYLVDKASLNAPPNRSSSIDMVLDRYNEIRIARHALVHNKGAVSAKNQAKLALFMSRLPEDKRAGSFARHQFLSDGQVKVTYRDMLKLRLWFYTTVMGFLRESVAHSW